MGILTKKWNDSYIITSDRTAEGQPSKRAPRRMSEIYQVWTGSDWSVNSAEALSFASLDAADEYVRANYARVSSLEKATPQSTAVRKAP